MKKYEPSAGLLDNLFQTLLTRRTDYRAGLKQLLADRPTAGFGVYDEREYQEEIRKHDEKLAATYAGLDLLNALLQPFEREAEEHWEFWQKRGCDAMMRL